MAVNNTENAYAKMEFPLTIKRQDAFSVDPTEVWSSLEEAQNYALGYIYIHRQYLFRSRCHSCACGDAGKTPSESVLRFHIHS